mgnify:CR=1 FL=1
MIIRKETPADIEAITDVTEKAFRTVPVSQQTEHFVILALRKANVLTLSLVAEQDGQVVGHIAFSPVTIEDRTDDWYGVGPLSVLPELQRTGIGSTLMSRGIEMIKEIGAKGCLLVGDPNYYIRFGYRNYPEMTHEGIPQEVFLALPFTESIPQGIVHFHEGFLARS